MWSTQTNQNYWRAHVYITHSTAFQSFAPFFIKTFSPPPKTNHTHMHVVSWLTFWLSLSVCVCVCVCVDSSDQRFGIPHIAHERRAEVLCSGSERAVQRAKTMRGSPHRHYQVCGRDLFLGLTEGAHGGEGASRMLRTLDRFILKFL